jgi:hypothetical protein
MKGSILLISLSFLISSYTGISYLQYYRTEGINVIRKDNCFVYENDSVKITYNFWANGGVMSYIIFNKLDKPLYIDWKRSSLIINSSNSFYYNDSLANEGYSQTAIGFLPPKTQIKQSMSGIVINNIKDWSSFETQYQIRNDTRKKETRIFDRHYDKDNSPVIFRNFLTLSDRQDFRDIFSIDNGFYIAEMQAMDVRNFRSERVDGTWEYYYRNPTDFYLEK